MKKITHHTTNRNEATSRSVGRQADSAALHRPDVGRRGPDPLDYQHWYRSLGDFARLLGLRYNHPRTRHAYYRQMRLMADHFQSDPARLGEEQLRDYILHVKTRKLWKPKTIRQAAARMFFVQQLGHGDWMVFSQIRDRDQMASTLRSSALYRPTRPSSIVKTRPTTSRRVVIRNAHAAPPQIQSA